MRCPHCNKEIEIENTRIENQKKGMALKAASGRVMSKPAYGYKIEKSKLIKDEEKARKIQELFNEFLHEEISLNKLADKYSFSVNGIKKILSNFTYIGKVKFDNQIHDGQHEAIISSTDFNHVQDKLDKILKK
jgi:DNA invertase Pin-like site-specific DNA recombinase